MGESTVWKTLKRRRGFENAHLRVDEEEIRTPTRERVRWTSVHRSVAVAAAPVTAEGRFVLIREERPPIRRTLWAFPAGQVDGGREPSAQALQATAWRELVEETGYAPAPGASEICEPLGQFHPSPGFCSESVFLFLLRPVGKVADPKLDEQEAILESREVTPDELLHWVDAGEIADGPSLALVARLVARGWLPELPHA